MIYLKKGSRMKISIIIPAYNEASRIKGTLQKYHTFFSNPVVADKIAAHFFVIPNGCTDNTSAIVECLIPQLPNVSCHPIMQKGKGRAIKEGFIIALQQESDFIGFVDADGATSPEAFYDLLYDIDIYDGVIASRYMPGSYIYPPRPFIKRWGSKLIYEPLARAVLGLSYYDFQCGAKVFKKHAIERIAPLLTIEQWAFDAELLHLCKRFNFIIKEMPTVWYDQDNSKLKIKSGFRMLSAIFSIKEKHKNIS